MTMSFLATRRNGMAVEELEDAQPQAELNLAIVGRTNVGKSALLNAILGQERSIVSPVAGTTRDALDTQFTYRGREVVVVDTAGMRRPWAGAAGHRKVQRDPRRRRGGPVRHRADRGRRLGTGHGAGYAHIAGLAWEMGRGVIVVVNKWDLRERAGPLRPGRGGSPGNEGAAALHVVCSGLLHLGAAGAGHRRV